MTSYASIAPEPREDPAAGATRLSRRWLAVARVAWLGIAVLALGLFIAAIPLEFAQAQIVCPTVSCDETGQISAAQLRSLEAIGLSASFYAAYDIAINIVAVLVFTCVAGIIFWRKSDDWMGLFGSLALLAFGAVTFTGTTNALKNSAPGWWLPVTCVEFLGQIGIVLFLYLFPDGRFAPRWMRWLAVGWVLYQTPATFIPGMNGWINRDALLVGLLWTLFLGGAVAGQIYRYRRVSSPVQRQQTKWVVFGMAIGIGGFLSLVFLIPMLFPAIEQAMSLYPWLYFTPVYLFILIMPISIGTAILRYRLWDIDVIISRTLVYGALTASVIAIYVLVVGYLATLFQTSGNLAISLIATGLVAVLFQPLRLRLQRGVNRLLYGERDDPYAVISRLNQRLEATLAPDAVLPTIVETVREALSTPVAHPLLLPLTYQNEVVGQLILAPRAAGEAFTPADQRLLDDLARQAGVAAHAVRLTGDLRRSRERLVTAREEERRRLRRDLHDGLGPQLATLTLKLDAARNLLGRDPRAAAALVTELKTQTQAAIADIRRLVYELRPPALDELGLVGALREQVAQYRWDELCVVVDAPERLPALPAAVEVAAYRIALEALTNVVRHADARNCAISLGLSGGLSLDIRDDGRGLPDEHRAGVGLHSMRERAAELGGSCEIASAPGGGTCVTVWLPLPLS
ncbi:MAG: sensor histidine kinase [Kouleothrix sp.]|nr:sensor histidine kinase [Kouleothrix sp.]